MLADLLGHTARAAGVPVRGPGRRSHPGRAAPGRPGGSEPADRDRRAHAGLRPRRAAPDRRARRWSRPGRRWSPSTSSSRRRPPWSRPGRSPPLIREGGPEGLPGVRAIGLWLEHLERRAGLDQRRGPPRHPPGRRRRGGRAPRRTGGRRAGRAGAAGGVRRLSGANSAARVRNYRRHARHPVVSSVSQWLRPSESAAPSTAEPPPARSPPGAAPVGRRAPEKKKTDARAGARGAAEQAPDLARRDQPRGAGRRLHVHLPAASPPRATSSPRVLFAVFAFALYVPVRLLPGELPVPPPPAQEGGPRDDRRAHVHGRAGAGELLHRPRRTAAPPR